MKVAIVHDWLTGLRGGERCLEVFLELYPSADVFTLLHVPGATTPAIDARVVETSFLQSFPGIERYYRGMLPLFPSAVKRFDFEGYDLVISLSHAAAKNIVTPPHVPHISYCFTPMRYIWDQAPVYFGRATPALWPVISTLRRWDRRASEKVRHFVAISRFIAARIRCYYGQRPSVIFPPVRLKWIRPAKPGSKGEAFLYAGALVPYKRADLVIETFNRLGEKLWVVGSGPDERRLRAMAGPTIEFTGRVSDAELAEYYRHCRALVFPGKEDFGMIPVECMAAGRPIIALGGGGAAETVLGVRPWRPGSEAPANPTGVFIRGDSPGVEDLGKSIGYFLDHEGDFTVAAATRRASLFSDEVFVRSWRDLLGRLGLPAPGSLEEGPRVRPVLEVVGSGRVDEGALSVDEELPLNDQAAC